MVDTGVERLCGVAISAPLPVLPPGAHSLPVAPRRTFTAVAALMLGARPRGAGRVVPEVPPITLTNAPVGHEARDGVTVNLASRDGRRPSRTLSLVCSVVLVAPCGHDGATMIDMRRALLPMLVLSMAACSQARSQADVEADAIKLVQTAVPGATEQSVREAMDATCAAIAKKPTKAGAQEIAAVITRRLNANASAGVVIIGASISAKCPQHKDLAG